MSGAAVDFGLGDPVSLKVLLPGEKGRLFTPFHGLTSRVKGKATAGVCNCGLKGRVKGNDNLVDI